eukprot:COSAG05_NODE_20666_length_277_cov_2.286517_1_plen_32_part_10
MGRAKEAEAEEETQQVTKEDFLAARTGPMALM